MRKTHAKTGCVNLALTNYQRKLFSIFEIQANNNNTVKLNYIIKNSQGPIKMVLYNHDS